MAPGEKQPAPQSVGGELPNEQCQALRAPVKPRASLAPQLEKASENVSPDMLGASSCVPPNVEGNRLADEVRAEFQAVCRRVRLTARLGPGQEH